MVENPSLNTHLSHLEYLFGMTKGCLPRCSIVRDIAQLCPPEQLLSRQGAICAIATALCTRYPTMIVRHHGEHCGTMKAFGTLLLSTNGAWYATREKNDRVVSMARDNRRTPLQIMEIVKTSCFITVTALAARHGKFKANNRVDLSLPVYTLFFGTAHSVYVNHGVLVHSVYSKYPPREVPLSASLKQAIVNGDLEAIAGIHCTLDPGNLFQMVPRA